MKSQQMLGHLLKKMDAMEKKKETDKEDLMAKLDGNQEKADVMLTKLDSN
jgi:hypothetical protein